MVRRPLNRGRQKSKPLRARKTKPRKTERDQLVELLLDDRLRWQVDEIRDQVVGLIIPSLVEGFKVPRKNAREVANFIVETITLYERHPTAEEYAEKFPKLKGKIRLF